MNEALDPSDLRVALFSGNYNYTRDGANNALNRLVGYLLKRGAAVRVYSPTSPAPAFPPTGDLVSVPSIAIPGRSEFRVALGMPDAIPRDVQSFAPTHFHLSAPDWLGTGALRLGKALGIPVFASLHTRFETYFEYYGLPWLRAWAINRQRAFYQACDHVFAPNEPTIRHLEAFGMPESRISIWSRGVDTSIFAPSFRDMGWRRSRGYTDPELVIAYFGRIVREKGIDCFAQTIGELRRRGRRVRPLVVGAGPAEAEFRRKVGDAHFTGHLEGQELGRAIASADVLLNPSVTEAFGNVNLEAMAAGLVVVSADAGSARAIISNGVDGLYCYPDPNELADCIEEVLDNPSRARGLREAAARTASVKRWEDVLEPVVQAYCYGQRAHVDVRAKAKNDDREELRADAAVARSPVG